MTIKSLLNADFTRLSTSSMRDFESSHNIQQLRQHLQRNVPDHQWNIIRQAILTQVEELLEIPLHPILVKSWHTHQAVKREIEQQQASSNQHEESIVVLDSHEIVSTHSPTLSTKVGGTHTINLRFFIGVTLQLKNVSLKIQQGEIKAILAGVMSGNGFMQHQNITLIEADFLHIKLASEITYITSEQPAYEAEPTREPPVSEQKSEAIQHTVLENNQPQNQSITTKEDNKNIETSSIEEIITEKRYITDDPIENIDRIEANDPMDITPEKRYKNDASVSTFTTNIFQFILGIFIAFIALYVFWQTVNS